MKHIYYFSLITAALLAVLSCQKEPQVKNDEVSVRLSAGIPSEAERKAGEALSVDILHYEIWNEDFTKVVADGTEAVTGLTASIDLKLIRNKVYNVILWAQCSSCTSYSWDSLKEVRVSYKDDGLDHAAGNKEERDAFYAVSQIRTHNVVDKYISLTRPFSQLNFFADDLDGADMTGYSIEVKGLSEVFDTVAGEGKAAAADAFAFKASEVFSTDKVTANGTDYAHVAMNYILLPGKTGISIDIDATFNATKDGSAISKNRKMKQVSVKMNERINVYGSLLTE